MEVMSLPRPERPFTERIDSKLTGSVKMKPTTPGQPCTVRFAWCPVYFLSAHHFIGGGTARKVERKDELAGGAHPVHGGGAVFRSKGACRGAILQLLMEVLPPLLKRFYADDTEGDGRRRGWGQFVPAGLVEQIVAGASGDESYACVVRMQVEVTRVYSEAEELLLLCAASAPSASDPARAPCDDDAAPCPICMDELLAAGRVVTALRDCSHAFHRDCVLEWFGKKPTCPCCRRDMMHHLDHRQPAFGARANSSEEREAAAAASSSEIATAVANARANPSGSATLAVRRRLRRAGPYGNRSDGRQVPVQRGATPTLGEPLLQRQEFQR